MTIWGRLVLALVVTTLVSACGTQGTSSPLAAPRDSDATTATDGDEGEPFSPPGQGPCFDAARAEAQEAADEGASFSEQRRRADQAFLACAEDKRVSRNTDEEREACRDAPGGVQTTTADAAEFGVYFSCAGSKVTPDNYPVHRVARQADATGGVEARVAAAVSEWLEGPTAQERRDGYFSATPSGVEPAVTVEQVTVRDGTAVVDFSESLTDHEFTKKPFAVTHLTAELSANVLQFESVRAAKFRVVGDCARFWSLLGFDGGSCPVLDRGSDARSTQPEEGDA